MNNIWIELNNEIPKYAKEISKKYNLKIMGINDLKTALIGFDFIILLSIDKFSASVSYIHRDEKGELWLYSCDNFLAEKYDNKDRVGLLKEDGVKEIIINELIIIINGLQNKWEDVLKGNRDWLVDFKKSKWYNISKLENKEKEIINKYI